MSTYRFPTSITFLSTPPHFYTKFKKIKTLFLKINYKLRGKNKSHKIIVTW